MCIRDRDALALVLAQEMVAGGHDQQLGVAQRAFAYMPYMPVSYTHLRAHETVLDLVCRLLLEKKNCTHK